MTPKEKAKQLISKFTFLKLPEHDAKFYNPKQCALIAVGEKIAENESAIEMVRLHGTERACWAINERILELYQIKTEIEKL